MSMDKNARRNENESWIPQQPEEQHKETDICTYFRIFSQT
jgi:hypothetical protein